MSNAVVTDKDFEEFFSAYLEAALWSTSGTKPDGTELEFLDYDYCIEDFDEESMAPIKVLVRRFMEDNLDHLKTYRGEFGWRSMGGHDLWLTCAGHGSGFWDGDWEEEAGGKLTDACDSSPLRDKDIYIGDDNKVYFM